MTALQLLPLVMTALDERLPQGPLYLQVGNRGFDEVLSLAALRNSLAPMIELMQNALDVIPNYHLSARWERMAQRILDAIPIGMGAEAYDVMVAKIEAEVQT